MVANRDVCVIHGDTHATRRADDGRSGGKFGDIWGGVLKKVLTFPNNNDQASKPAARGFARSCAAPWLAPLVLSARRRRQLRISCSR